MADSTKLRLTSLPTTARKSISWLIAKVRSSGLEIPSPKSSVLFRGLLLLAWDFESQALGWEVEEIALTISSVTGKLNTLNYARNFCSSGSKAFSRVCASVSYLFVEDNNFAHTNQSALPTPFYPGDVSHNHSAVQKFAVD